MAKPPSARDYSVTFARLARKELEKLPETMADRILDKIENLAKEPRPSGAAKLQGYKSLWRIRIGDYRVVYSVDDTTRTVDVSAIRHRKEGLREVGGRQSAVGGRQLEVERTRWQTVGGVIEV